MGKVIAFAAVLLAAGCTHSRPIEDPRKVWCDHNEPRRPSVATIDAMSRPELDELNAFNAKGAAWCGWKP